MTRLLLACLLFAQRNRLDDLVDSMGSGFRERRVRFTTENIVIGVLAVVVTTMVVAVLVRLAYLGATRLRSSPGWLFHRIANAQKLRWKDRWLLWQLARHSGLADPARVFVEPERYAADRLPSPLLGMAARLMELREKLFAAPPTKPAQVLALASPARPTPPAGKAVPPAPAAEAPPAAPPLFPINPAPTLNIGEIADL